MPGKIFISYRRDDDPSAAARVGDALAAHFGKTALFMDVENLRPGQRFDDELSKALTACDVLIAIIGPKWMELLDAKSTAGKRDHVREEIGAALKRRIVVIPVRIGRDGSMPPLPRSQELPADIRELVNYQKHDVTHERFGRDVTDLAEAIGEVRRSRKRPKIAGKVAALVVLGAIVGGGTWASRTGLVPWPGAATAPTRVAVAKQPDAAQQTKRDEEAKQKAATEATARTKADEAERLRLAAETRRKADEDALRKARADEAERQRLAEAKRVAEEEAARKAKAGNTALAHGATGNADPANTLVIELRTGNVQVMLRPDLAPKHVEQFKRLAREGFYNGLKFHRVIGNFMAQTGDPTGSGTGRSKYGNLQAEFSKEPYRRGTVGAARTQDINSANSQFFICLNDTGCNALTGQYTVWGRVIDGMEHVDQIVRGDPPAKPDVMQKVYLLSDAKK